MLIRFRAKNFGPIKNEVVLDMESDGYSSLSGTTFSANSSLKLLKSVSLYGHNGSGKSTLLQALDTLISLAKSSYNRALTDDLPYRPYKISYKNKQLPSLLEVELVVNRHIYQYGFEYDQKFVRREWLTRVMVKSGEERVVFERENQSIALPTDPYGVQDLVKRTRPNVLFLSMLAANNIDIALNLIESFSRIKFMNIRTGGMLDYTFNTLSKEPHRIPSVSEFMRKAEVGISSIELGEKKVSVDTLSGLPDNIREVLGDENREIISRSITTKHINSSGQEVSFRSDEESQGTQDWLASSVPILETLEKGYTLLVDELSSLHPSLCRYLVLMFNSELNQNNAQLVIVSHDLHLLSRDIFTPDQVNIMEKTAEGSSFLINLADDTEANATKTNYAKHYIEGRFSELPYFEEVENLKFSRGNG